MSMIEKTVLVPDIGGADGAEVVDVLVQVGDTVEVEQSLLVLESDKASMEIPAPWAGVVKTLLVAAGDELSEGAPVLVMTLAQDSAEPHPPAEDQSAEEKPQPETPAPTPAVEASAPQAHDVMVPDTGGDGEVELTEICVAVGDSVSEGDSLVVLESDKASMEVPAPVDGVVSALQVSAGVSVSPGQVLMTITGVGSDVSEAAATVTAEPVSSASVSPSTPTGKPPQSPPEPVSRSAAAAPAVKPGVTAYAGPAVRKLAREFGIALEVVSATGPRGRILKEDLHQHVRAALEGGAATLSTGTGIPAVPAVDFSAFGPVSEEPLSRLAKLTAANMQRSWLNVPHVTQFDDADISDLETFRKGLKAEAERRGVKLTPIAFVLMACARVLRQHPRFLSSLSADGESLISKDYCHIGMAVDTPAGLVVPVIRDADQKTLWELAAEVLELAAKARDRKLRPDDMQGGCFTISSLGGIGGRGFTPIINTPEVGILAVSRAAVQPVWDGEQFQSRTMLPLSLSYDHRVINGGDAGRFLTQLVTTLGDIRHMLL